MANLFSPYTYGALGKVAIVGSAPALSDFHKWLHPEIAIAGAPMPLGRLDAENLAAMGADLEAVFDFIQTYDHSDLAFFSCTSGSLVGGEGYDERLCALCARAARTDTAYTTSTAVRRAFDVLGVKSMSIITPYPDDVNKVERDFFAGKGFEVCNIDGIPTADPNNRKLIYKIPPEVIYDFAVAHTSPRADICFLSCTGLRALDVIPHLEERLGIPVVTSNQTAIWLMGNYFGRHHPDARTHLGQLFQHGQEA
jgi:maleate isomerase